MATRRRPDHDTVEDRAAKVLASAFSSSYSWMARAQRFRDVALALSRKISGLTRIERDMLHVYALMDWRAAERVILWMHAQGHNVEVAANALRYRILFPHARKLHHNTKDRARDLHMREIDYRAAEYDAYWLLCEVLHGASMKFWDAYTLKEPKSIFPQRPARYREPETSSIRHNRYVAVTPPVQSRARRCA